MIIYFEGPDGSGKSTLLNNVYDNLDNSGYRVIANANIYIPTHPREERRVDEKTLYYYMKKMAKDKNTIYLVDRGPISDLVYRVFDDYTTVTTLPKLLQFMKENENNIFTIYCRTDLAEVAMKTRGDDNPVALSKHKELTRVYDLVMSQFAHELKLNFVKYDFSKKKAINEMIGKCNYFAYLKVGK